jgi:hypothetical protein
LAKNVSRFDISRFDGSITGRKKRPHVGHFHLRLDLMVGRLLKILKRRPTKGEERSKRILKAVIVLSPSQFFLLPQQPQSKSVKLTVVASRMINSILRQYHF